MPGVSKSTLSVSDGSDTSSHNSIDVYGIPGADVVLRSSDGDDFPSFKVVLAMVSPFFATMFSLDEHATKPWDRETQVVPVTEDSRTLEALLRLCHPSQSYKLDSYTLEGTIAVVASAQKYQMDDLCRLRGVVTEMINSADDRDVMRVFALLCTRGMRSEAHAAAMQLLCVAPASRQFVPELEGISTKILWQTYDHYYRCVSAATRFITAFSSFPNQTVGIGCTSCPSLNRIFAPLHLRSPWLSAYLRDASADLALRPRGSTLLREELINKALSGASDCGKCRPEATVHFKKFAEQLANKVEEALSQVSLELDI